MKTHNAIKRGILALLFALTCATFLTFIFTSHTYRPKVEPYEPYEQRSVSYVRIYNQSHEGHSTHFLRMVLSEYGENESIIAEVNNSFPAQDVSFRLNNSQFCRSQPVDVLFYVLSSPGNHKQRDAVRETWGKATQRNGRQYKTLFFVGVNSTEVQKELETEMEEHKDLVQIDIHDSYFNLTLKGISAIQWMSTYCPDVQYVIKIDDDVVIDPDYLDRIIGTLIPRNKNKPSVKVLCSKLWFRTKPAPKGYKNYMPSNVMEVYPTYCNGNLYGYPGWLLRLLRLAAHQTPIFPIEDIYTTGLLLPQLYINELKLVIVNDLVKKEKSKEGPDAKW